MKKHPLLLAYLSVEFVKKDDKLGYGLVGMPVDVRFQQILFENCMSGPGSWLNTWELQPGEAASLEYIRKICNMKYKMKP